MPAVISPEHLAKARRIRQLFASYSAAEDLIRIGAYQKGSDPVVDQALLVLPAANAFLQQDRKERAPLEENIKSLLALPG
jgi:flagellum-specific ATP synthase